MRVKRELLPYYCSKSKCSSSKKELAMISLNKKIKIPNPFGFSTLLDTNY